MDFLFNNPLYTVYKRCTLEPKTQIGWKRKDGKIFHVSSNQKKAGMGILISHKIDFKIKTVTRDKDGHYIMIKG